jgi:hypothetical protein
MSIADQSWPRTQWYDGGVNVIRGALPAKEKIELVLRIFGFIRPDWPLDSAGSASTIFSPLSEHKRT